MKKSRPLKRSVTGPTKASVVSPRAVQRKPPWGAETPVGPVHVEKGHHVPRGAETPVGPVHVEEVRHVPWGAETPIGPVHVEKGRHVPWGAETPVGPVRVEEVHHVPWGAETPIGPVHVEKVLPVSSLFRRARQVAQPDLRSFESLGKPHRASASASAHPVSSLCLAARL